MKEKFIFSYIGKDENGIYKDMTSEKANGIIDFLPSHKRQLAILVCEETRRKSILEKFREIAKV